MALLVLLSSKRQREDRISVPQTPLPLPLPFLFPITDTLAPSPLKQALLFTSAGASRLGTCDWLHDTIEHDTMSAFEAFDPFISLDEANWMDKWREILSFETAVSTGLPRRWLHLRSRKIAATTATWISPNQEMAGSCMCPPFSNNAVPFTSSYFYRFPTLQSTPFMAHIF
ncbi:hypothetical protein MIND_01422300 [Mycena indigotica]|uniref:Uncharacterized protein n=1 Tax=Mycena indigotica TaxID=2126181 RepID=A0A8H6VNZ0_9AGAR|nr:uncharacterized protein MIND_01422300 [Mycena indigotica]KAF7288767.1 hypothetical protein MIND_01422300 [Mycena indigotica]